MKKNLFSYLDEETLEPKKTEESTEPKVEDFNANARASIFATEDLVAQNNNIMHDEALESQPKQKSKAEKDKPVVYISDRESDDSAFYDTIKGPDTPTQDIQATWEK